MTGAMTGNGSNRGSRRAGGALRAIAVVLLAANAATVGLVAWRSAL
ncbi:MAG: hypothetical protein ACREER_04495 [Alphaproteobacteria bacterium]